MGLLKSDKPKSATAKAAKAEKPAAAEKPVRAASDDTAPIVARGLVARGYTAEAIDGKIETNAPDDVVEAVRAAYSGRSKK